MANIVLKTFAAGDEGQGTVTPQDDSLIYQNAVPVNGIFGGATVTLTGANTLHVASGFGIICGRFFEINESDISVQLSSSGTLSGRLKIHLDLNNADNPIEIVTETGSTLPALSGDSNININGGAFDMELCTFSVNELTISSLINTFPTINNTSKQVRRKTAYAVNDFVLCQSASDALIFVCATAGTTAIQEPKAYATVTDGNTVTDGTAVFKAVSVSGQITKLSKTEVLISNSGDAYDPTRPYKVGELCIYNNILYRCITACSAGSWAVNQNCFTADTLIHACKLTTKVYYNSQIGPTSGASGWQLNNVIAELINEHEVSLLFDMSSNVGLANGERLTIPNFVPQELTPGVTQFFPCIISSAINGYLVGMCGGYIARGNREFGMDNYTGYTVKHIWVDVKYELS